MVVEHVFVTTHEKDEALAQASALLGFLGFRTSLNPAGDLVAARGRKNANRRKVVELPQTVQLSFDRGRVTVAAAITPRGGKEQPIYAELMGAVCRALECRLVNRIEAEPCVGIVRDVEIVAGKVWLRGEKFAIGCLIALLALVVLGALIGFIAAVMGA